MKTDDIRSAYIDFFAERGAKVCSSDSLVPGNDPTLLFTGAGMNQFKDYFLGIGKMDFTRATSCQKCIRTGDIMNVGVTSSHHTFFEMLGNFSFGDYFKEEAITWAWEFLTGVMKIDESRLQVSVHHSDDEAFTFWKDKIGVPEARIFKLGDHDNFWPADAPKLGPNGPCGPCSEIFFDRGEEFGPGIMDITHECRRWVEIWNLVFTQFDRQESGALEPLSQKNIDTGMGLERMASCMQGAVTNMDIDIFQPIVGKVAEMAETAYGKEAAQDVLMRRVADHARAVTFCIGDGVMPANSHRGYVLKRLLRRAVLDGRNLGIRGAFLKDLAPVVGEVMKQSYPEVHERIENIAAVIETEERKFLATLEKGLTLIDMAVGKAKENKQTVLSGATAFELYDTYGFPYELAEEVVEKEGLTLDREGFDDAMAEAKRKAREGAQMDGNVFDKGPITEVKKITGETKFLGYDAEACTARVIALIAGDALVEEADAETAVTVVLNQTTFYGEAGGQVGDTGIIVGPDNLVVEISDTKKIDNIHFHVGTVETGRIRVGMEIGCEVDVAQRADIRRNHTTTHLLHKALRQVLGERAEQKGSFVSADRLRFDYRHGQALSVDERHRIEEMVNRFIMENHPVTTEVLPVEEARKQGAVALFGEKYGDEVRVVKVGDISAELCGGTHMTQTAPIGSFRLIAEESVAAGVRRIEGVTGNAAYRLSREQGDLVQTLAQELKAAPGELVTRVDALLLEAKDLKKELASLRKEKMQADLGDLETTDIKGAQVCVKNMGDCLGGDLKDVADTVKQKLGDNGVAVLAGTDGEKVAIVVTVGKGLAPKTLKAGDVVKQLAPIVGGGGGGRPDMAQAGGKDPSKFDEMLAAAPGVVEALLG